EQKQRWAESDAREKREMAEIQAEIQAATRREMREKDPKYSQDTILEYRRKVKAGDFAKAIVSRVPVTPTEDEVELSCGHTRRWPPAHIDLNERLAEINKKANTF